MLDSPPTSDESASGVAAPLLGQGDDVGSVHVVLGPATTRVVLAGEVDSLHLTFIDSTGIAFLARAAIGGGQKARLVHASSTLRFLLCVTGFDALIDISDDPPDTSAAVTVDSDPSAA